MGTALKWIGIIWAIIGGANILMTDSSVSDTTRGVGLIFNMLAFIIPGLLLAGVGVAISRKPDAAAAPKRSTEARLQELAALHEAGAISTSDYAARKQDILKDI